MHLSARQNARLRERVRLLTQEQGLSERGLAERAGLSIGTIRSVGQTASGPTLSTLLALAEALKIASIDQLLGPTATQLLRHHDRLEREIGEAGMTLTLGCDIDVVGKNVELRPGPN